MKELVRKPRVAVLAIFVFNASYNISVSITLSWRKQALISRDHEFSFLLLREVCHIEITRKTACYLEEREGCFLLFLIMFIRLSHVIIQADLSGSHYFIIPITQPWNLGSYFPLCQQEILGCILSSMLYVRFSHTVISHNVNTSISNSRVNSLPSNSERS